MPRVDIVAGTSQQAKTRTVMLTLTEDCNLRCSYCYEATKRRDRRMSLEVAQQAITEAMNAEDEFENIEFDLFGGEPLLEFDLMRRIVDFVHSRQWRKKHVFSCCTNGTVLNDAIQQWLVANPCVKPAVSLDGNKVAHDLNRSNSYDLVMQHLPFFQKHWPEQPLKMTISAATIPHVADSIIELEEKGLLFTANVAFENIWGTAEQKSALLEIYAEQLERLVEYYAERPHLFPAKPVAHKIETTRIEAHARVAGGDCVRWCGAGHEMVVIDADGNRFPCHRFAPWVTRRAAPQQRMNRQTQWKPDSCADCRLVNICPVCAGFNWQENGDTGIRTTYHCDAFKLEVLASAKLQALRLLQRSGPEVAQMKREEAHVAKQQLDAILDFVAAGV